MLGPRWVRLTPAENAIIGETAEPVTDWSWLTDYLQLNVDLDPVLAKFPADEPISRAVKACRGLRLLRQDPWECLASFILSSTKQIVQIQQIIALLCERYGKPVRVADGQSRAYSFPFPDVLAEVPESDLRACRMGFRAPYLRAAAAAVADGTIDFRALATMRTDQARTELLKLPGVGRKIADCVLLFAFGFQDAFPVDVWIKKALSDLYFPNQRVTEKQLRQFSTTHFGSHAGYAQQYLFHYMRMFGRRRR